MSDMNKNSDQPAPVQQSPDSPPGQTIIETPMPTAPKWHDNGRAGLSPAPLDLSTEAPEAQADVTAEDAVPAGDTNDARKASHPPVAADPDHHDLSRQTAIETPMLIDFDGPLFGSVNNSNVPPVGNGEELPHLEEQASKPTDGDGARTVGDVDPELTASGVEDAPRSPGAGALVPAVQVITAEDERTPEAIGRMTDDWPEPDPFDRPIDLASPHLSPACLPDRLYKLAMQIAGALGVPLAYVVISMLVSVAALVGCSRRIRVTGTWVEPSNLAGILVGAPGLLKSHLIDFFTLFLRLIEKEELTLYREYCSGLAGDRVVAQEAQNLFRQKVRRALSKEQPLPDRATSWAEEIVIPEPPAFVTTWSTPQALRALVAKSVAGVFFAPDELTRFNHVYASPDARGLLMASLDGRYEASDLISRGRTSIDHMCISLLATIQPEKLPQVLGADDGLMARLMWIPASRQDAVPRSGAALPTKTTQRAFEKIRALVPKDWGKNAEPVEVTFEPRAAAVICDTRAHLDGEARTRDGLVASAYAKAGGTAVRLASAIDLLSYGLSSRTEPGRITLAATEAAVTLVKTVLLPSAEAVLGQAAGSEEERDGREILAWMLRVGLTESTQRDIQRRHSGRLARADVIGRAVEALEARHLVRIRRVAPGPAGGAPKKLIQVNPKILR